MTATDVPAPSTATGPEGLSEADVRRRVSDGQTNQVDETTSRTVGEIVRANVLTRFNAILAVLAKPLPKPAAGDAKSTLELTGKSAAPAGDPVVDAYRRKLSMAMF